MNELSKMFDRIETYYENTIKSLALISKMLSKIAVSESWMVIKVSTESNLRDVYEILIVIKQIGEKNPNQLLKPIF